MFMPETDLNVNSGYSWIFLVIFFSPLNTERVEVEIPSTRYLSWLPATVAHKLHSCVTARTGSEGESEDEASARKPLLIFRFILFASLMSQTGHLSSFIVFAGLLCLCSHNK